MSEVKDGYKYTDHYENSRQAAADAAGRADILANQAGRGKWFKQVIKNPLDSTLWKAMQSGIAGAQRAAEQSFTYDPAMPPELQRQQLNKTGQDIQTQGLIGGINTLAGAQQFAAGANLNRRLQNSAQRERVILSELDRRAKMQGIEKNQSMFSKIFSAVAPFLSMIPIPGMQALGPLASMGMKGAMGGVMGGLGGGLGGGSSAPPAAIPAGLGDYNPPSGAYG